MPLIPGLAARIFALTDADPAARPLRDVLLRRADGFILQSWAEREETPEAPGSPE